MKRSPACLAIWALVLVPVCGLALQAAPEASRSGCIDQQDGLYVLVNDRSLEVMAQLEADGFPTEGFAKHVGHKVTVHGSTKGGGASPFFRVRRIDTISETCSPAPEPEKKP